MFYEDWTSLEVLGPEGLSPWDKECPGPWCTWLNRLCWCNCNMPIAYCKLIAGRLLLSSVIARQVMQIKAHPSLRQKGTFDQSLSGWHSWAKSGLTVSQSWQQFKKVNNKESRRCVQMSTLMKHYPRVWEEHGGGRREVLDWGGRSWESLPSTVAAFLEDLF